MTTQNTPPQHNADGICKVPFCRDCLNNITRVASAANGILKHVPPQPPKQSIREEIKSLLLELAYSSAAKGPDWSQDGVGYPALDTLDEILALLVSELKAVAAELPEKQDVNKRDINIHLDNQRVGWNQYADQVHQVINRKVREIEG